MRANSERARSHDLARRVNLHEPQKGAERKGAHMSESDPWLSPPLSCDVVMKGGITSGVVYPGAVVRLAKRYRFRSIGGTSAGALAAVAVAAAEYGRPDGFRKLAAIPGELGKTVGRDPFVLTLFPPEPANRRLFRAALGFQRHGLVRGILGTFVAFWRFPIAALALALIAIALALSVSFCRARRCFAASSTPR
jgi:predicted acylesterase/phospholipase RssA